METVTQRAKLLVRCRSWLCALPLSDVVETLRLLPLRPVAGVPPFVRGLVLLRGALVPVVELGTLLGAPGDEPGRRLVVVRADEHLLALAVDEVLRVITLELEQQAAVAPLLSQALPEQVAALGTLDGAALAVLSSASVVSAETWALLGPQLGL